MVFYSTTNESCFYSSFITVEYHKLLHSFSRRSINCSFLLSFDYSSNTLNPRLARQLLLNHIHFYLVNSRMNTHFISPSSNNAEARLSVPSIFIVCTQDNPEQTNNPSNLLSWLISIFRLCTMCLFLPPCHFTFFSNACVGRTSRRTSFRQTTIACCGDERAARFSQWQWMKKPTTRIGCKAELHANMWV